MEDVHGMCERQRLSLQSAIATGHPAPMGPLRATHPNTHSRDGDKKRKDTVDTPQKPSSLYEKSARVSISYLDCKCKVVFDHSLLSSVKMAIKEI